MTGAKSFASDLALPGMLHGKVLRPPAYGAPLRHAGLGRARSVPGVVVLHEGSFAAVAGPDPVTAARALALADAAWDRAPQPREQDLAALLRSHPLDIEGWGGRFSHETGDATAALDSAGTRVAATYTAAYIAHVPLEPRAAVAEWSSGRLTVWTGTQRPFWVRHDLAQALGVAEAKVRVIVPWTGSGFGGKHTGPVAVEAALLARAAGPSRCNGAGKRSSPGVTSGRPPSSTSAAARKAARTLVAGLIPSLVSSLAEIPAQMPSSPPGSSPTSTQVRPEYSPVPGAEPADHLPASALAAAPGLLPCARRDREQLRPRVPHGRGRARTRR